jgi:hypothetical protein
MSGAESGYSGVFSHSRMQQFVVLPGALCILFQIFARRYADVILAIIHLLFVRCPAAIKRLVVAIYIHTIKRLSGRTFAHISQEVFKTIQPAIAHADATTTVSAIFSIGLAVATSLRVLPSAVFSRVASAVRSSKRTYSFACDTSAASDVSAAQRLACYNCCFPALAKTSPCQAFFVDVAMIRDHRKASKNLPYHIDFFHTVKCNTPL